MGRVTSLARREADPAMLRAGLLGVVLAVAPLTVLLGVGDTPRGENFDTRPWVFASDLPLAALLVAAAPAVARSLRRRQWTTRALAALTVLLSAAWLFHPTASGALQVFRVAAAVAVAGTVVEASTRDGWRVVLAVAAALQTVLAITQVAIGGNVGVGVIGEMTDPFHPVGDVRAPSGTLLHPYVLAAHALVAGGVLVVRATARAGTARAGTARRSLVWAGAAGIAIAPVGFTYSRAAALGAVALVAALGVGTIRDRARFGIPLAAIVVALGVTSVLGMDGWSGRVAQTTTAGTASDLTTGRGELMRQAVDVIRAEPLVGVGPGRYVESLPRPDDGIRKPVHNLPLLAAAEGGLLAGLAAVGVLLAAGWRARRGGWPAVGLWLAFLPLLLLDHLAYTFPVGVVLLGVWAGSLDRGRLPSPAFRLESPG